MASNNAVRSVVFLTAFPLFFFTVFLKQILLGVRMRILRGMCMISLYKTAKKKERKYSRVLAEDECLSLRAHARGPKCHLLWKSQCENDTFCVTISKLNVKYTCEFNKLQRLLHFKIITVKLIEKL